MGIVLGILMVIFVGVCLLLAFIILLQSSKGDSLASGVFGGAGMQTFFGGRGATTFLSKLTTGLAIAFILLSLILSRFYGAKGFSPKLKKKEAAETQVTKKTEKPKVTKESPKASVNVNKEKTQQKTSEENKTK